MIIKKILAIIPTKNRETIKEKARCIFEYFGISRYSKPSLNNLDDKLSKYLNYKNGFFIEVGANDGFNQSNTYYLEKIKKWNGLLIEAIPELYEKCKEIRSNSKVFNCALVSNNFYDEKITINFADLMSIVDDTKLNNAEKSNHLNKALQTQNIEKSYKIEIQARTLSSILSGIEHLPEIDFFSLDVEGYELEVLQGMDIERYRPKYIMVEANYPDEIKQFLSEYYYFAENISPNDLFFIRK